MTLCVFERVSSVFAAVMVKQLANTGEGDAMTENSRIVAVVKGQLSKFSGIISKGLPKAKQRLVREMVYGIQASKDIKLSSITRSLNEAIPLIKTEDRLSRNLDDRDFTEGINRQICRLGSRNVLDDMVIAIEPGNIRKKHAAKMECLCTIHDGSEHEIGDGYWLAKAVAADIEHKKVIPLYLEAYSREVPISSEKLLRERQDERSVCRGRNTKLNKIQNEIKLDKPPQRVHVMALLRCLQRI